YQQASKKKDAEHHRGSRELWRGHPRNSVGRTPRSARDPLVTLFELSADSHQADEGVGRGPGVRPTGVINFHQIWLRGRRDEKHSSRRSLAGGNKKVETSLDPAGNGACATTRRT